MNKSLAKEIIDRDAAANYFGRELRHFLQQNLRTLNYYFSSDDNAHLRVEGDESLAKPSSGNLSEDDMRKPVLLGNKFKSVSVRFSEPPGCIAFIFDNKNVAIQEHKMHFAFLQFNASGIEKRRNMPEEIKKPEEVADWLVQQLYSLAT